MNIIYTLQLLHLKSSQVINCWSLPFFFFLIFIMIYDQSTTYFTDSNYSTLEREKNKQNKMEMAK